MASNDEPKHDHSPSPSENKTVDVDLGKALEGGMAVLQKVFEGIATAAKKAIGPEVLRSLEAASWLGRVASCFDETAAALRDAPTAVAGKAGELACHLERLDAEIQGSKFVGQQSSLKQRLEAVIQAITVGSSAAAAQKAAEAAGYFRAAANSVGPLPTPPSESFNFTIS